MGGTQGVHHDKYVGQGRGMKDLISVIIRTKNEERWIAPCLKAVFAQKGVNLEVIVVDNESSDRTLEKVRQFPVARLVTVSDYLPGKALNAGIMASQGEFFVCLSGHCIPVSDSWLFELRRTLLENSELAGVYGRQEPMAFSSDSDKRDLLVMFGLDPRIQIKDSFFHNANSMIPRRIWEEVPFDATCTNIEDRIWAQAVIRRGYKIAYNPAASVYHYHGIHQNGNQERCTNVVRILESLNGNNRGGQLRIDDLDSVALIPVRGPLKMLGGKPALAHTITAAKRSRYLKHVVVTTDDPQVAECARLHGAEAPFLRPSSLSEDYVSLEPVLSYSLEKLSEMGICPDLVISLEITYPFRKGNLIDEMIEMVVHENLDSALAARREYRDLWRENENGKIERLDNSFTPRQFKEKALVGLKGLCCVTRAEFLREQQLLGPRVGLYQVNDPLAQLEVRSEAEFALAEHLIGVYANSW